MKKTCADCKFFAQHSDVHAYGSCRRHAPKFQEIKDPNYSYELNWTPYRFWPNTRKDDWCGDFVEAAKRYCNELDIGRHNVPFTEEEVFRAKNNDNGFLGEHDGIRYYLLRNL